MSSRTGWITLFSVWTAQKTEQKNAHLNALNSCFSGVGGIAELSIDLVLFLILE
jgi:hypothetical protein